MKSDFNKVNLSNFKNFNIDIIKSNNEITQNTLFDKNTNTASKDDDVTLFSSSNDILNMISSRLTSKINEKRNEAGNSDARNRILDNILTKLQLKIESKRTTTEPKVEEQPKVEEEPVEESEAKIIDLDDKIDAEHKKPSEYFSQIERVDNEDGTYTIITRSGAGMCGGSTSRKTYSADGKLLKKSTTSIGTMKPYTWTTVYNDDETYTVTFSNDVECEDVEWVKLYNKDGSLYSGVREADGLMYQDGVLFTGEIDGKEYEDGVFIKTYGLMPLPPERKEIDGKEYEDALMPLPPERKEINIEE